MRCLHSFLHAKYSKSGVNFTCGASKVSGATFQVVKSHM